MAEGRDLVKEAMQDAKSLKEAAVESAKNQLVEELTPAVRQLLDRELKVSLREHRGGIRTVNGKPQAGEQRADYFSDKEAKFEEGKEPALDLEQALQEFFPGDKDKEKPMADEKKEEKKSSKKEAVEATAETVSEEIEISEAELRKVYEEALKTEVNVKKGFGEMTPMGELDDVSGTESGSLSGATKKDKPWEEETPPAAKDYSVKEAIKRGIAENKALRENLRKAVAMIETLGKKLHEVNLFNSKVLHVNKILNAGVKLTREQKTFVMETVDKARSISEVKVVYEALMGSFKSAQTAVNESRNPRPPKADAQRIRTSGTPKPEVLSESVDRAQKSEAGFSRMRELAGLVNGNK